MCSFAWPSYPHSLKIRVSAPNTSAVSFFNGGLREKYITLDQEIRKNCPARTASFGYGMRGGQAQLFYEFIGV
jgi:hypothetical protein